MSLKQRLTICAILCVLSAALAACGGSGGNTSYTPVTLIVGGAGTPARAPKALRKAMPAITSVTFTIEGPDMPPETRTVAITQPQTITEVFFVTSGPQRIFTVTAADAGGTVLFRGSSTADLNGTPVSLPITLQTTSSVFALMAGTDRTDAAAAIVRDSNGDIIIAGHTFGDLGGPNADPSHQTPDLFVTKLTPTGLRLWTVQTGTTGYDVCFGAATDPAGNIYLTGSTDGNLHGEVRNGLVDAYVVKLDASGKHLWTRLTGTTGGTTFGNAAAVDAAGNVFVAGDADGGLDGNRNAGGYDIFVVKYDANGARQWTRQAGTPNDDFGDAAAADAAGMVTIAGATRGDLGGANAGTGFLDIVVLQYDAAGSMPGSPYQFGTADDDTAFGVALDGQGGVYVSGETWGDLDGTGAGSYGGLSDAFVLRHSAAGGPPAWIRQFGSAGNDAANGVTIDPAGNVLIAGQVSNPSGAGFDADIFVMKYDAGGTALWAAASQFGTAMADEGRSVASDGTTVFVLGNSSGTYSPSLSADIVLLEFDSATGTKY
jgi:hypothetical protein